MKISAQGLDKLISGFGHLESGSREMAHRALYKAAGAIADEVKAGLQGLPVQEDPDGTPPTLKEGQKYSGVTSKEKQSLIDSMGIAGHRESNGTISTAIGFSGTSPVKTKRFPGGIPNGALMRGVESGTSIRTKHPVLRPAVNRAKQKAVEAAKQEIIEEIKKEV